MTKPSPYQIAAFAHAARTKSFSAAARAMGVTQSSVTQHVAKLEQLMGQQLFIRRRSGLEMTRAARELFEIADRWQTLDQLVQERVAEYHALGSGQLTIIANAPRPAMPVIAEFIRTYPHIRVKFSLHNWTTAMKQLRDREVDVAIVTEPEIDKGLYAREFGVTRYAAHVHRDHPLAQADQISLTDLRAETIVLPEDGSLTMRVFQRKIGALGLEFPRMIQMTSFPMVKEAVLHGLGVASSCATRSSRAAIWRRSTSVRCRRPTRTSC